MKRPAVLGDRSVRDEAAAQRVRKLMTRIHWRQLTREALQLGYIDLGGEG
jgi:hypothetical protein